MSETFTPTAYMKSSCPFCFKVIMFLAEAGLMDKLNIVRIETENTEKLEHYREKLQALTGKPASFPTIELTPGQFVSDSDELISYFAEQNGIDPTSLPGLAYYKANLMPAYIANFKALKALKQ